MCLCYTNVILQYRANIDYLWWDFPSLLCKILQQNEKSCLPLTWEITMCSTECTQSHTAWFTVYWNDHVNIWGTVKCTVLWRQQVIKHFCISPYHNILPHAQSHGVHVHNSIVFTPCTQIGRYMIPPPTLIVEAGTWVIRYWQFAAPS